MTQMNSACMLDKFGVENILKTSPLKKKLNINQLNMTLTFTRVEFHVLYRNTGNRYIPNVKQGVSEGSFQEAKLTCYTTATPGGQSVEVQALV